jgi:hypothetical protein
METKYFPVGLRRIVVDKILPSISLDRAILSHPSLGNLILF